MSKSSDRISIPKWLCLLLVLFFLISCVAVGLIVYHLGLPDSNSSSSDPQEPVAEPEPQQKSAKVTDVRLPVHLEPIKYKLELVPFIIPNNFTIRGNVKIQVLCHHPSSNITVHAADLSINNDTVVVADEDGNSLDVEGVQYDKDREFFIINLSEQLIVGKMYTVEISYIAYLKDNLKGFYRSQYFDRSTNTTQYIAVTQFQATDARRAFPCFDEPGIKAQYEVSLGRKRDMTSISNMPIEREGVAMAEDDDYVWDMYQESVRMSTYLVAFVVSKFDYVEETLSSNNVRFRIWSTPNTLDQTQYAKQIGPRILEFFETYFNVKFPLPKQDMIAIPDFGAGAMENWGLITYRETALLFKEGVSNANNKERIAIVVSHELAHQWFGNLVTPSWWTDLWLNEGFASYVEYLGVDAVQPELKLLEQFVVSDLQDVFRIDALESSHPISIPVKHPDEIQEIFDRISYGKGASIIRMMDNFLTTNTFRQGLTVYLRDLAYKAATQDDLWQYLTQQGHQDGTLSLDMDVKTIMDTWTLQMGFPLVTINRNYQDRTATVSQSRFLVGEKKTTQKELRWWVPLTFTDPNTGFNNTYNKEWLRPDGKSRTLEAMPAEDTPVIFNVQQTGYYRVNYDKKNWALIAEQLNRDHTKIHVINRAQILDDALNLAKSGFLDYGTALSLTSYLSKETEYIPWSAALSGLSYINKMLKRTSAYGDFKRYMLALVNPLFTKLGFVPSSRDSHLDTKLRSKAIAWACSMGSQECKARAGQLYSQWMETQEPDTTEANPIDVNLKYETYCNAISDGSEEEWDFGWSRYKNSQVASEKSLLLNSLGCTKNVWLLNRYLNKSLYSDSGVRKQDGYKVLGGVGRNTVGRYLVWDFIRDNWDTVSKYYSGFAVTYIGRTIKGIADQFNTKFELQQLVEFQEAHKSDLKASTRDVKQALEAAGNNVKWMEKNFENIWTWLQQQQHELVKY